MATAAAVTPTPARAGPDICSRCGAVILAADDVAVATCSGPLGTEPFTLCEGCMSLLTRWLSAPQRLAPLRGRVLLQTQNHPRYVEPRR